jgi:hypothetical protein
MKAERDGEGRERRGIIRGKGRICWEGNEGRERRIGTSRIGTYVGEIGTSVR